MDRKESVKWVPVVSAVFLICCTSFCGCLGDGDTTIRISGAWALYPMMVVWADEYQQTHDVSIEISGGGAGKGVSDVLNGMTDIGMVSRPLRSEELAQGVFYVAVTKDAVVATINKDNPALSTIQQQGLSRDDLESIFLKEITHWGDVIGQDLSDDKIVVLGRSDASGAAQVWASYLGNYTQSDLQSHADANYDGDMNLASGAKQQKNAIGFNNLNYAYDIETGGFAEGIRPVPLDLNGNDILDFGEDFYINRQYLADNVSIGIYPSPPSREEYLASKGPFQGAVKDFVLWILTDGQALILENGYVQLSSDILQQERAYAETGMRG